MPEGEAAEALILLNNTALHPEGAPLLSALQSIKPAVKPFPKPATGPVQGHEAKYNEAVASQRAEYLRDPSGDLTAKVKRRFEQLSELLALAKKYNVDVTDPNKDI